MPGPSSPLATSSRCAGRFAVARIDCPETRLCSGSPGRGAIGHAPIPPTRQGPRPRTAGGGWAVRGVIAWQAPPSLPCRCGDSWRCSCSSRVGRWRRHHARPAPPPNRWRGSPRRVGCARARERGLHRSPISGLGLWKGFRGCVKHAMFPARWEANKWSRVLSGVLGGDSSGSRWGQALASQPRATPGSLAENLNLQVPRVGERFLGLHVWNENLVPAAIKFALWPGLTVWWRLCV